MKIASLWILRLLAAAILGQTLFFKFSGAAESVAIFETLGAEPWGRIASGVFELIAVVLLLWPGREVLGALLGAGVMTGAIGSHLTILGIEVESDGGLLFALALVTFGSCVAILAVNRADLPIVGKLLFPREV